MKINAVLVTRTCEVITFTETRSWKRAVERVLAHADSDGPGLHGVDHVLFCDVHEKSGGLQKFTVAELREDLAAGRVPS